MTKIINYQGSMDTLVWRKDEKDLTFDTEVIVPVSHEAIFVRNGQMTDTFGLGRHNFESLGQGHLFLNEQEKVNCTVYYVKKEGSYNIKWETSENLAIQDPVLNIPVEFKIGGVFAINIIDTKLFLSKQLAYTQEVALEEVKAFFREKMLLYIKEHLLSVMQENHFSILDVLNKTVNVSKLLEVKMHYILESYGVSIEAVMIKQVDIITDIK